MSNKQEKKEKSKGRTEKSSILAIIITILLLLLLVLLTKYYGSTDVGDYSDTAKFFAGEYKAKLRSSHSVIYGLIHAPFVKPTKSFIFLKLSSVLWLALIILSVYYISNKNKKTLLLIVTSPVIWYMGPWISPIPLSSLLGLWSYYFIKKHEDNKKYRYLFYSGGLFGLAWAFWDPMLYFAFLFGISFLYNEKASNILFFFLALFVGVLPRLILDQYLFGLASYSVLKHLFAEIAFVFYSGIYGQSMSYSPLVVIPVILFIPFFSYILFSRKLFFQNKKILLFLVFSFILIFLNAEIRATLIIVPIFILLLGENLNKKQFKIQIIIFFVLTLITLEPYLIQIKYSINNPEFSSFITNLPNLKIKSEPGNSLILQDLNHIQEEYPNQTFVVGNNSENYQFLADIYWGKGINEFISIEDYNLFLKNSSIVFKKTICSSSKSWNRRDICISTSLEKPSSDNTDYNLIKYAISLEQDFKLKDFKLAKKYQILRVFEKVS